MSEPGPVTNRDGRLWSCDLTTPEIYRTLQRLEAISFLSLKQALERVRLDPKSRREDDNTLDTLRTRTTGPAWSASSTRGSPWRWWPPRR